MKHRQNGNAAIEDRLPVRICYRCADLFFQRIRLLPPAAAGGLLRNIGLTAGRVRADVCRVAVIAPGDQLIEGVGSRRHRLRLQRLLRKGGRHLRRRDPHQIVLHGHIPDGIAVQHPQRLLPVMVFFGISPGRRRLRRLPTCRQFRRCLHFYRLMRPCQRQQKHAQQRRRRHSCRLLPDSHIHVPPCLSLSEAYAPAGQK